jgi:hypothetical protein
MTALLRTMPLALPCLAPADMARAAGDGPVAEIVTFRLADGIGDARFLDAARATEAFVRAAPGFVARRLTRGDDGRWTDYVEWDSLASAQAAAERIMADPGAADFIGAIAPDSIEMRHEALRLALDD